MMNTLVLLYAIIATKISNSQFFCYAFLILFVPIFLTWIIVKIVNRVDDTVQVRSSVAVENYDFIKYFKEDRNRVQTVEYALQSNDKYKVKVNYTSPAGRKRVYKVIIITSFEINYVKSNPSAIMTTTEYNQMVRGRFTYLKRYRPTHAYIIHGNSYRNYILLYNELVL